MTLNDDIKEIIESNIDVIDGAIHVQTILKRHIPPSLERRVVTLVNDYIFTDDGNEEQIDWNGVWDELARDVKYM